jgi:DNA invertase Pin-like site-specific DNA recombinase
MANVGYARVSTSDQNPKMQEDALRQAGCSQVFVDRASGTLAERPQLTAAMAYLREGDVLVVWRLDRLGRSLQHLVHAIGDLRARGIGFRSLTEAIDTATPSGTLMLHLFGAFAQFERDLIAERTNAGLAAARARGRKGGRKPLMTPRKANVAREMYDGGQSTVAEIAETIGVSRATVYRHLSRGNAKVSAEEEL